MLKETLIRLETKIQNTEIIQCYEVSENCKIIFVTRNDIY